MAFQSECHKGYLSVFSFGVKCVITNKSSSFTSENIQNKDKYLPINKAIVNDSLAIGIGHSLASCRHL
ncbi:unnamed protein product [Macrosiphum euphorbiae]|uniref:Uncharacterized protein n=1 Tax=Macrosiphum euphorbiae TaxID=13131 RepID=A0AAV0WYZ9_9HEMI|nr:unnamed protein product [Macrosiphum euphorbiae]